ncbi:MAG: FMN-binding protein, partial [Kosmotogaceae bacterium]|nr:FMN-binding protein [Kosmotogaceae bacterium]
MKYAISVSLFLVLAIAMIVMVFDWQAKRPKRAIELLKEPFGSFSDGVYTGREGYVSLEVEVVGGKIIDIRILQNRTDRYAKSAESTADRIVEAQSLEVDLVTGATASSESIIAAVKNALG